MRLIDADALPRYTGYALSAAGVAKAVENAPTIEAEPVRRGRWVVEPGIGCWCSACGFDIGNDLDFMEYVHYCPHCGARMEEQE